MTGRGINDAGRERFPVPFGRQLSRAHHSMIEHPHPLAIAVTDEAEAIVLDFISPLLAGRHRVRVGRQARLDETGRSADRTGGTPKHGR